MKLFDEIFKLKVKMKFHSVCSSVCVVSVKIKHLLLKIESARSIKKKYFLCVWENKFFFSGVEYWSIESVDVNTVWQLEDKNEIA
jgi:hypothetical protein